MVTMTRSKTFQAYLPSCHRTYSCIHCRAHLANHDELISKSFQGSQGRAYLFNAVVNVGCGPAEERVLLTGLHAVADIYCENCKTTLGWKYVRIHSQTMKVKCICFLPSLLRPFMETKLQTSLSERMAVIM
ncbi:protein yippee-like 2 isoform X1 [Myxocyprinus asiaticus]|uniref:protein yippee-like 2 isoform X1 n=1 Tax=Myxocyprinus asiaticus TaxID=70543 RepID=UPI002222EA4F|nr:protein yippee-like 2 isoform X1 [Myxocyprinus asiaticus]